MVLEIYESVEHNMNEGLLCQSVAKTQSPNIYPMCPNSISRTFVFDILFSGAPFVLYKQIEKFKALILEQ